MDVNLNSQKITHEKKENESVETAGTIAKNTPTPLFTTQTETAGTIACNSTSSNNGGGSSLSALG